MLMKMLSSLLTAKLRRLTHPVRQYLPDSVSLFVLRGEKRAKKRVGGRCQISICQVVGVKDFLVHGGRDACKTGIQNEKPIACGDKARL